ncbi:MAG TPA: serine/threonine-protein kinase [Myxococcaceae bacterium]|nr:serine/threonine-protein kinase [Myxococcaceae bacterium]
MESSGAGDVEPTASLPREVRDRSPDSVPLRLEAGEMLADRFNVLRFIARGGMGEVYEALDNMLGVRVALKVIVAELADSPEILERFQREVLLSRQVSHRNVCRMFELYALQHRGARLHFLIMEFLEGESLAERLSRDGPLPPARALPILRQIADGLDAAHREGVVHRDLKPANVMLVRDAEASEARAVVTDFGIARSLARGVRTPDPGDELTGTNQAIGTPHYMAPEQRDAAGASPATDIYALGVLACRTVTGRFPFEEQPWSEPTSAGPSQRAGGVRADLHGIPAPWRRAILRALQPAPERRFPSAGAMVDALSPRGRARRWAFAAGALLLAALGTVALREREDAAPGPPPFRPPLAVAGLGYQGPPETAWLGPGLAFLLELELEAAERSVRLVPWHRVVRARASLDLGEGQALDDGQAGRLRELLATEMLLTGDLRCEPGGDPTCVLRVHLPGKEALLVERFRPAQVLDAATRLGEQARSQLSVELNRAQRRSLRARRPAQVELLKGLSESMSAFARFELVAAADRLRDTTALHPGSHDAHALRSFVLQRLALFTEAQAEARAAHAAAGSLSASTRRRAEARVAWLGRDREAANGVYSALLREHPDDVELGLELATGLTDSACVTLTDRLGKLPPPSSADPRILIRRIDCLLPTRRAEAEALLPELRHKLEQLGARRELAAVEDLSAVAIALANQDRALAAAAVRRSIDLSQASGDRAMAALTRLDLGSLWLEDHPEALVQDQKALSELRQLGDRVRLAYVLNDYASHMVSGGRDVATALRTLDEAEGELAAAKEPPNFMTRYNRVYAQLNAGELIQARREIERVRNEAFPALFIIGFDIPYNYSEEKPEMIRYHLAGLEKEILLEEDRLDEARGVVEGELRAKAGAQSSSYFRSDLCYYACLQRWDDGARRCYAGLTPEELLAGRHNHARCSFLSGDLAGARQALDRGSAGSMAELFLSQGGYDVRLALDAASTRNAASWARLEAAIARAAAIHQNRVRIRLEVLRGRAEAVAGRPLARPHLEATAADARARGLLLWARKAEEILAGLEPSARPAR